MSEGRLGLPVQQDDYKVLCDRAGENVGALVGLIPLVGGIFEGMITKLVSTFPRAFCGSGPMISLGGDNDTIAEQACSDEEKSQKKKHKKDNANNPNPPPFDFDFDRCTKDRQKQLDDQLGIKSSSGLKTELMTPKAIFDSALIGDIYFQVWGIAKGQERWTRRVDAGVKISAWNRTVVEVKDPPFTHLRVAQAEFYFDKPGAWDDNVDDSMWEMRWRARLRRIRFPISSSLVGSMVGKVMDKIQGKVLNGLMKKGAGALELIMVDVGSKALESYVDGHFGPKSGGFVNDKVNGMVSPELIH